MTVFNSAVDFLRSYSSLQSVMITVFLLYIVYYFLFCHGVPPGPWGMPVLGFWPFLKSEGAHLQLKEFREKYGEIFSFSATGNLFICLSSIKAIKEALLNKSDCFEGRWSGYSLMTMSFEGGLAAANGEPWSVQRKFFTQKFKEYGMLAVKKDISGSLYDILNETVDEIRAMEGKPFDIAELLTAKCALIIRRILFNDQGISEEELKELNQEYGPVLGCMTHKNLLLIGNIARYLVFPFIPSYWAMLRSHHRIRDMLKGIIQRHKLAFDDSQAPDIIDCFYKEKEERKRKGDPSEEYFTDQALISSVYQFVTDGVLSVSFFISLVLHYLVDFPEEQEKLYEELIEVIGTDRQPAIEDKSKLPYTNAFIYEVIRFPDSFPMFPSAQCTRETTLNGYKIPKGSIMLLNTYSAHYDPTVYEDPFTFNPSRFITTQDKQRPDLPILFGVGKRACMGEPFTVTQTFLFITTIVKNFRLTYPEGAKEASKSKNDVVWKVLAIPRTQDSPTREK